MRLVNETNKSQGASAMFHERNWKMAVAVFGIIVGLITLYFLILPGVSMEKDSGVLDCQLQIHQHEDGCYDENGDLQCGMADFVVHSHSDGCYDTENNLICTLEEIEEHTHDDECYQVTKDEGTGEETRTLVCDKAEIKVHQHDEECFEKTEDTEGGEVTEKLICGKLEVKAHEHGQGCFIAEKTEGNTEEKTEGNTEENTEGNTEENTEGNTEEKEETSEISEDNATGTLEGETPDSEDVEGLEAEGTEAFEGDEGENSEDPQEGTAEDENPTKDGFTPAEGLLNEDGATTIDPEDIDKVPSIRMAKAAAKAAVNNWRVDVDKTWSDGNSNHSPVTVQLWRRYTNGTETNTGRTLKLSGSNSWNNSFTGLYKDDTFEYFVKEVPIDNWDVSVQNSQTLVNETWTRSSVLQNGGTYAILLDGATYSNGKSYAVQVNSITYQTHSGAGYGLVSATSNAITEYVPENMRWTFRASSSNAGYYYVYNEGYNQYLVYYTYGGTNVWGTLAEEDITGMNGALHMVTPGTVSNTCNIYAAGEYNLFNSSYNFRLYRLTTSEYGQKISLVNKMIPNSDDDPNKVSLEHKKQIDYLGDGQNNPDTNVQGDDLYRLYLDVKGTPNPPVDLLIVLDRSGSMSTTDMKNSSGRTISRAQAINDFLNGEGAKEGFIKQFLDANEDNRLSIVDFGGVGTAASTSAGGYAYTTDASIIRDWGRNYSDVTYSYQSEGTNYSAGLKRADDQFERLDNISTNEQKTHRRMMVFLSDGVPTFYIDQAGNRQGNGDSTSLNAGRCKEPSQQSSDSFTRENSEVYVNTIGFFGSGGGEPFDPAVLQYMADSGGGEYKHSSSSQQLTDHLLSLTRTSNAAIGDNLSLNVLYYSSNPDLKMTMKNSNTGQVVVLYQNGSVTTAGTSVLKDITYMPPSGTNSNGSIQTSFQEGYNLDPDWTYTVSYNIEVTKEAYEKYIVNGYGDSAGDDGTDYGTNDTSSGKSGFPANNEAYITYTLNGYDQVEYYDHPVVQVGKVKLKILKTDMDGNQILQGAKFELYREADSGETGGQVQGLPSGRYIKVADLETDQDGIAETSKIIPGKYYLIETEAPSGYTKLREPVQLILVKNETRVVTVTTSVTGEEVQSGTPVVTVKNGNMYELPETGGIGVEKVEALGVVLMLAAVMFVFGIRRHEKRDSG